MRGVLNFLLRTKYYEEAPDYGGVHAAYSVFVWMRDREYAYVCLCTCFVYMIFKSNNAFIIYLHHVTGFCALAQCNLLHVCARLSWMHAENPVTVKRLPPTKKQTM